MELSCIQLLFSSLAVLIEMNKTNITMKTNKTGDTNLSQVISGSLDV